MASSKQRSSWLVPFELVEEILYRTPSESLVRFKSVCKRWYGLLDDQRFIYKHLVLDLSKERFLLVDRKKIQLFNPETEAFVRLPTPDEFYRHLFSVRIHCDGLFLCTNSDIGRELAVWNPILKRVKWIKPSKSYKIIDVYGFGYDNVSRDNYKILRIDGGKFSEIEIYEFKSKLWRSVDTTLECNELLEPVSMNGNMYWIAQKKMEIFIQSFDFSTETFKPICCAPLGIKRFRSDRTLVLSGFGRERLSLLHQHNNVNIEVWVTNKVTDEIVSWSTYFNVTRNDLPRFHIRFNCRFLTNKLMLWCCEEEGRVKKTYKNINVYEMGEGKINQQVEMRRRAIWSNFFCSPSLVYVPSLLPVPE